MLREAELSKMSRALFRDCNSVCCLGFEPSCTPVASQKAPIPQNLDAAKPAQSYPSTRQDFTHVQQNYQKQWVDDSSLPNPKRDIINPRTLNFNRPGSPQKSWASEGQDPGSTCRDVTLRLRLSSYESERSRKVVPLSYGWLHRCMVSTSGHPTLTPTNNPKERLPFIHPPYLFKPTIKEYTSIGITSTSRKTIKRCLPLPFEGSLKESSKGPHKKGEPQAKPLWSPTMGPCI